MGVAGLRCLECASLRSSPLYRVETPRLLLSAGAGLATAAVGGALLGMGASMGFFLQFWLGMFVGGAVGEVVLRVTGRKRGPVLEITAGVCAGLGVLLGVALLHLMRGGAEASPLMAILAAGPYLLGLGTAVFSAVSRIRFL